MNTNFIIVIAVVAILVGGGATYLITNSNDEDKEIVYDGNTRFAIYGNVNCDDYIDSKDVEIVKQLASDEIEFDKTKHRYADANTDGTIDDKDVEIVEKLADKQATTLHYVGLGGVKSINYPLTGTIASHHVYPLDALIILGLYDKVVGMTQQGFNNTVGKDTARFPGVGTRIVNIGDAANDPEKLVATGAKSIIFGNDRNTTNLENFIRDTPSLDLQIVYLPMSMYYPDTPDLMGSILMLGFMYQAEERAHEYIDFVDGIQKDITDKAKDIATDLTYMTPLLWSSGDEDAELDPNEIEFDVIFDDGSMYGDVYTINKLLMRSVNPIGPAGEYFYSDLEKIIDTDPDTIFVIGFNTSKATPQQVQKNLDSAAKVLKDTDAYKNGRIYGVNYYNIANYAGVPTLPLLASFIWPDVFDRDDALDTLKEYYKEFTLYGDKDITTMGYCLAFQMSQTSA